MKYKTLQSFIAWGKAPDVGEIVELTDEQAAAIPHAVAPYEVKVKAAVENKAVKKRLRSVQAGRVSPKRTAKKSKRTATK